MHDNYDDDQHLENSQPNTNFGDWCRKTDSECRNLNFSAWECECGPGWISILDVLFHYADEWNKTTESGSDRIQIEQVKEKFGGLRFYYTGGSPEFRGMVEMAEIISKEICVNCGNRVSTKGKGYWCQSLCSNCKNQDKTEADHLNDLFRRTDGE
jgi:hypothetical protein